MDLAVRDGLLRSNPAAAVKRPGVERKDAPHLTADQAQAVLEAIGGDRLETSSRVMLANGLRRGEALTLHWPDVDLDAGLVRVRWTLSWTSQGLQLDEPKTDRSRRTVPLPRSAIEALRAHRTRQREEQHAAAQAQMIEGNLVEPVEQALPLVGVIQVAGVPRRCEFGSGEIHQPAIAATLDRRGYDGGVALNG